MTGSTNNWPPAAGFSVCLEVFPEEGCATLGFWTWDCSKQAMFSYVNVDQAALRCSNTALLPLRAFNWKFVDQLQFRRVIMTSKRREELH
jgi:hypothetical protein